MTDTPAPAIFVDLYESVEQQISEVHDKASARSIAGDIIVQLFTFLDDNDIADVVVEQHKRIAELEELCNAQQQQLNAAARQASTYQQHVIERDAIIADKSRLLRSQNDIICGLHEQRRREVGEISTTVIALLQSLGTSSVTITDERLAVVRRKFNGAHYALTRFREDHLQQTRFEITQTVSTIERAKK